MNSVPFGTTPAPSSTVAPPRSAYSSPKAPPSTAQTHAGPRSQQATRGEGRPQSHATKGREGFAEVLATAREQDPQAVSGTSDMPREAVGEAHADTGDRERVEPGTESEIQTPVPVAEEPHNSPRPVMPWLLLALEQGSTARPDPGTEAAENPRGGDAAPTVPGAVPAAAPAWTPAADGIAAAAPPGDAGSPIASEPAAGAPADTAGALEAPSATAAAVMAASTEPSMGEAAAFDEWREAEPLANEVVTEAEPPATAHVPPSLDALARWRAAARGVVGEPGDRESGTAAALRTERDASRPAAPGAAVSRLAQLLGRPTAEVADMPLLPPEGIGGPLADAPATPVAVLPTARATEVLQRLVQGANEHGPREPAAPHVPFGQVLSPAWSGTPASDGVAGPSASAPLPPAVGEQVTAQIVTSLRMQWKDGIGEAKLHLRPDALGAVTVALRVEHGAVTAVVRADSPQVQDWVLQHQQALREQMEAAGLHLDELTVSPDDRGRQGQQEPPDRQRRGRRQTPDSAPDAPRFELLA